jgi:hypothetical protein
MIGGRSSGHLREGRSRGHLQRSMRRGVCTSTHASHCALIAVVRNPACLAPRAENYPSLPMLCCSESQLRHGLRVPRLCIPMPRSRRSAEHSFPACRAIRSEAHLVLRLLRVRQRSATLAPPQWIKAVSRMETFAQSSRQVSQIELRASSSWPLAAAE